MRVLQVVPAYFPASVYGGPIFSIHNACEALARQGVDIQVATTNANGAGKLSVPTDSAVEFEANYRVRYYDDTIVGRFSWPLTVNLRREIISADLVHLQDIYSICALETLLLARLLAKPLLVSPRGSLSPWGRATKRPLLKKAWLSLIIGPVVKNAGRVAWHTTAEGEHDEVQSLYPMSKVYIVPNAIDRTVLDGIPRIPRKGYLSKFFPKHRTSSDDVKVLVGMGRLHLKKSFDVAIKAFHTLLGVHPDAVLLIAGGDDGERGSLTRLITELGLDNRVALLGEVTGSDKIAFLKGADLFLFPSQSENFGMVALEALTAGLPIVASCKTPWADVETRGTGRWVENSPDAFAAAAVDLLSRDLVAMREKAHNHAALYDITEIARAFHGIYLELIDANE